MPIASININQTTITCEYIGVEDDPNLNNMSFAHNDDEDPPSPWTVKRKSILKKPDTARKLDSSLNISKI